MRRIIQVLAVIVIVIAASYLFFEIKGNYDNQKLYEALMMQPDEENRNGEPAGYNLDELMKVNPDCVGIVEVVGTGIYYPVLLSGQEDGYYYMKRNFYKEPDARGSIFMDYRCDPNKPSTNLVLYGHRMRSNQMFAPLKEYKSKKFWQEHQWIHYTDINGTRKYRIFTAYLMRDPSELNEQQKKYQLDFINAKDNQEIKEFISVSKSWSYYNTDVKAEGADQFITLKTCDYAVNNGRIVVVGVMEDGSKEEEK